MKLEYFAVLAMLSAAPAFAGDMAGKEHNTMSTTAPIEAHGTLNSIDASHGTVNISHAPIAAIGWPAMTMDFTLERKTLAVKLKAGDAVKFTLKKQGESDYVITSINAVK